MEEERRTVALLEDVELAVPLPLDPLRQPLIALQANDLLLLRILLQLRSVCCDEGTLQLRTDADDLIVVVRLLELLEELVDRLVLWGEGEERERGRRRRGKRRRKKERGRGEKQDREG